MNVLVKELVERQAVEKRALGERIVVEAIADLKNDLVVLGCEDMISLIGAQETVVQNTISINKGKVVKVEVEKIVEKEVERIVTVEVPGKDRIQVVEDFSKIEEHLDTIAALKAEIEQLKKEMSVVLKVKSAREKQIEEQKEMLQKDSKRIAELEKQLASKKKSPKERVQEMLDNTPDLEDLETYELGFNEDEYLQQMAAEREAEMYHSGVVTEEIQETKKEVKAIEGVKELAFKSKNSAARMFETEECFFMASEDVQEITMFPKHGYNVTTELETKLQALLVDQLKFRPQRRVLSPVTITKENGYFARVDAVTGQSNFSKDDKFAGYVTISGIHFMWTWQPAKHEGAVVRKFEDVLNGNKQGVTANFRARIEQQIQLMYVEYMEGVDKLVEANNKQYEDVVRQNNENKAKNNATKADRKARIEAAKARKAAKNNIEKEVIDETTTSNTGNTASQGSSFSKQQRASKF